MAAAGFALAAFLVSGSAHAQRSSFDGLRQCERHAAIQFRRHDPLFQRFTIDRASASADKFADRVGTQFVSTIYSGDAVYEGARGVQTVRFICLHAGYRRGPVFVYTLPE